MHRERLVHAAAGMVEVSDRDPGWIHVRPPRIADFDVPSRESSTLPVRLHPGLHIVGEDEDGFDLQPVPEELVEVPEFRPMMGSGEPSEVFPEDFDYDGNNTGE
jgi:hypothetical protein